MRINDNILEIPPYGLELVESLQELELQGNRLKEFYQKASWPLMKSLDLARNLLTKIPLVVTNLTALRTLNLAYNQIMDFRPLCCQSLAGINVLDLSNNKITEIPETLWVFMRGLTHLNLENNDIAKIQSEIGFMKLQSLKIEGNPIKLMRRGVLEKGTVEILGYLRSRHEGKPPEIAAAMEIEIEEGKQEEQERDKENFGAKKGKINEKQGNFNEKQRNFKGNVNEKQGNFNEKQGNFNEKQGNFNEKQGNQVNFKDEVPQINKTQIRFEIGKKRRLKAIMC